jgi:hypothetical protein
VTWTRAPDSSVPVLQSQRGAIRAAAWLVAALAALEGRSALILSSASRLLQPLATFLDNAAFAQLDLFLSGNGTRDVTDGPVYLRPHTRECAQALVHAALQMCALMWQLCVRIQVGALH